MSRFFEKEGKVTSKIQNREEDEERALEQVSIPRPETQIEEGISPSDLAGQINAQKELEAFGTTQTLLAAKGTKEVANSVANQSITNSNMSDAQKQQARKELKDPDKVANSITRSKDNKNKGKTPNTKDSFMEALTFFLPSILGGVIGSAIAGDEGAGKGAELGLKAGTSFSQMQLEKKKLEESGKVDPLEKRRIEAQEGNLEQRKKEVEQGRIRTKNLEEDRKLRREERELGRSIKSRDKFKTSAPIKKIEATFQDFNSIEDLVLEGKKIPGALASKVARAVAGEVGVLTDQDVARAGINPDIYNKVKNNLSIMFKGQMSSTNRKEAVKIVRALRAKAKGRLKERIGNYSKSESSVLGESNSATMRKDLFTHYGLKDTSDAEARRKRIQELKNKEGK